MSGAPAAVTLRPVTPGDDGFLYELYASSRREEIAAWGWTEAQASAFLRLQFEAQRRAYATAYPCGEHRVVLCDGQRAGCLLVARRPEEIRVVDIALVPQRRGSGVGSHLLGALLEEARASGRPIRLHVATSNAGARRLYHRLGFLTVGSDAVYAALEWRPAAPEGGPSTGSR